MREAPIVNDFNKTAEYIADSLVKTIENAFQLCREAKALLDAGARARGLSLSVLAIEEIGKVFLIDGLVFSTVNDERALAFHEGFSKHKNKLEAAAPFPLAVPYFCRFESAGRDSKLLKEACAIVLHNWSQEKNRLMRMLGESCSSTQWVASFSKLNKYKQAGFYVDNPEPGGFAAPEALSADLSEAVYIVAWRMAELLHFIIGSDISVYRRWVESVRGKLSPAEALELRVAVTNAMQDLFDEAYEHVTRHDPDTIQ
jgi:AbiV family abortive infection protein